MFSKFFRREGSDPFARPCPEVKKIKNVFHAVYHQWKLGQYERQWNQSARSGYSEACRQLLDWLECVEAEITQKRARRAYDMIVGLHKEAKHSLMMHGAHLDFITRANGLIGGLLLRAELPVPTMAAQQEVYRYSHQTVFPEHIFINELLPNPLSSQLEEKGLYVHGLFFTRVALELFLTSARLIHDYEISSSIDVNLAANFIQNKKELSWLAIPELTAQQMILAEEERVSVIKAMAFEQGGTLIDPTISLEELTVVSVTEDVLEAAEKEKLPGELFVQFIRELEEQHHRREIFLAIATYDCFKTTEKPKCKEVWQWMRKNLSEQPFETSLLGHHIEIVFRRGAVGHLGLLRKVDEKSKLQESTFKTICFPKIKPIVGEIKNFLQENNIRNIPSIP